jgi:putative ABC transport system substrate-binding protein
VALKAGGGAGFVTAQFTADTNRGRLCFSFLIQGQADATHLARGLCLTGVSGARANRSGAVCVRRTTQTGALDPKRLGLLRELAPQATLVGVLLNPNVEDFQFRVAEVQEAARTVGLQIHVLRATAGPEIDAAFAALSRIRAGALVVGANAFFRTRREQIVALAARHAIPAIYDGREYAAAGGLVSYGTSLAQGYRQVGVYTGRILKGAKPADLPVVQASKFELVINAETARMLGLALPPTLLATADEVIE